jgi:hypothetical protein
MNMLESLYLQPVISVEHAAEEIGVAISSANRLVAKFEKLGLLQEITGKQRNRRFAYQPYLEIFADPETERPTAQADIAEKDIPR